MAITFDFRFTVSEIIEEAFDEIQVAADGEDFNGELFQRGRLQLNRFLEEIGAYSLNLWLEEEGTLFTVKGQNLYKTEQVDLANDYLEAQLTADAIATATQIIIDDVQTMAAGHTIIVILDDNTSLSTTILGIASNTLLLADALPSAAATANFVYTYIPNSFRPIAVVQDHTARYVQHRGTSGRNYEIQMNSWNRKEFFALPLKEQAGVPTIFHYHREDSVTRTGIIYLWVTPNTSDLRIQFSYYRRVCLFLETDGAKFLDAPDYFQEAIILGLAYRLGATMGTQAALVAELKERSDMAMSVALGFNTTVSGRSIQVLGYPRA